MELSPAKLHQISRFFFVFIAIIQGILLSSFVVCHDKNDYRYFGFAGLLFLIPSVGFCFLAWRDKLKYNLGYVWLFYSFALVTMIAWIFGKIVIEDDKLKEEGNYASFCNATVNTTSQSDSHLDSKVLKVTLCFTPGEMLLLLTSVTDETETLAFLYFTSVLNLFDGVEMLEVLNKDVCNKIPKSWKWAVLGASCLFFLLSYLEIHKVKFTPMDEAEVRKKTAKFNTFFQIVLNLAFLAIRLVLWFYWDFDSTIFLAKNIIGLLIALVPLLQNQKSDTESQTDNGTQA